MSSGTAVVHAATNHLARWARGEPDYAVDETIEPAEVLATLGRRGVGALRAAPLVAGGVADFPTFRGRAVRLRSRRRVRLGRGTTVADGVTIDATGGDRIHLGRAVTIGAYSILVTTGVLKAAGGFIDPRGRRRPSGRSPTSEAREASPSGASTICGPGLMVFSENHEFSRPDVPIKYQGERRDQCPDR